MKDDLENVKNLGTALMKEMQGITSDFRIGKENSAPKQYSAESLLVYKKILVLKHTNNIFFKGFGSFVEKTVMPYISTTPARLINPCTSHNCTSPFSYKNVLKLTNEGDEFNRLVSQQQISGNLDSPEGGFDAIMQVAVCEVRSAFFSASLGPLFSLLCIYAKVSHVLFVSPGTDRLEERDSSAGVFHRCWFPLCRRRQTGRHRPAQRWEVSPGEQHVHHEPLLCMDLIPHSSSSWDERVGF